MVVPYRPQVTTGRSEYLPSFWSRIRPTPLHPARAIFPLHALVIALAAMSAIWRPARRSDDLNLRSAIIRLRSVKRNGPARSPSGR